MLQNFDIPPISESTISWTKKKRPWAWVVRRSCTGKVITDMVGKELVYCSLAHACKPAPLPFFQECRLLHDCVGGSPNFWRMLWHLDGLPVSQVSLNPVTVQSHAHPSARARPCHRRALPTPPPFHGSTPTSPAQKPPKEHGVPPLSSSQPCGGRSCNTLKFASFGNRSKMIKFGILCSLKHRK